MELRALACIQIRAIALFHWKRESRTLKNNLTRREVLAQLSKVAVISSLPGMTFFPFGCGSGNGNTTSPTPSLGDGYSGTDDQLLEEIEKAAFLFFWEQADPATGQVKDRALAAGNDTRTVSSIAATGFGLRAL